MMKFLSYHDQPVNEIDLIPDFSDISDPKTIISLIESDFLSNWENIRNKGDFSLIEKFAGSLKKVGDNHNAISLMKYADMLIDYADSFDIVMVEKLMNQFPKIIEKIRENQ